MVKEIHRVTLGLVNEVNEVKAQSFNAKIEKALGQSASFFSREIKKTQRIEDFFEKVGRVRDRLEVLGLTGFEPLILQRHKLKEDAEFWHGRVKPSSNFFDKMFRREYPLSVNALYSGVYLIDSRANPKRGEMYEDDNFMEDLMSKLRLTGDRNLRKIVYDPAIPIRSRCNTSGVEIKDIILHELRYMIGDDNLQGGKVRLPRYSEILAGRNMGLNKLGTGDTLEWFNTEMYGGSKQLIGSHAVPDNSIGLDIVNSNIRRTGIGFRILVGFYRDFPVKR